MGTPGQRGHGLKHTGKSGTERQWSEPQNRYDLEYISPTLFRVENEYDNVISGEWNVGVLSTWGRMKSCPFIPGNESMPIYSREWEHAYIHRKNVNGEKCYRKTGMH